MNTQEISFKFPKGRTAFIIIHGVGEQIPYETVDHFARNLIKHFEGQSLPIEGQSLPIMLEHLIAKRRLPNGNPWIESFVRLTSAELQPDDFIDVHEYYWAADTENQISVQEVLQWAEQTLEGTIAFYSREENQSELKNIWEENNWNKFFTYRLRPLTIFLRVFNILYPWLRLLVYILLLLLSPFLQGRFLQPAWKLSRKLVTPLLVNFVGDVAIYTTTNVKSPYQKIREQILAESLTLLKAILKDKEANYDQVIIAGHSLGSCIAYDTLNLLCIEASLSKDQGKSLLVDKITGLITFGSPLDKMAFFFRETAQQHQYIRQRILEHLSSFRVKPLNIHPTPYLTKNPVKCQLEKVCWVNYYHSQDPISGHLDYYDNLKNVLLDYETSWGEKAHLGYWTDPHFYKDIAQRFLSTKNGY
jgi:hypothetical protein